jgi:ubiquinone/menaquinone biosynthesis C-methylase UbiE
MGTERSDGATGAPAPVDPAEKVGMRNAWGRVAVAYDEMWVERTAHMTRRGLDLLAPEPQWDGCDVACGPGNTAAALAERLPQGRTLGLDFAEPMVARAREQLERPGLTFALDDAERLSQPSEAFDAVTCSFGLMYCYHPHLALAHMARILRPGGRLMLLVWGRARDVWWSPVIESVESRAAYYSAICPMVFFYGLPSVLPRMVGEAGLEVLHEEIDDPGMRVASVEDAVEVAILGGPLAGLFAHRLDAERQAEVRAEMLAHIASVASADGDGVRLPSQVAIVVARKPTAG